MYLSRIEKLISMYSPVPLCIINAMGKVSRANDKIKEVFIYDGIQDADVFALTGIKHADLIAAIKKNRMLTISRNDKVFRIMATFIGEEATGCVAMYFFDITNYEQVKVLYREAQICVADVNVDNFDELTSTAGEENRMAMASEIDRAVRGWGAKMQATIARYTEHQYLLAFERAQYERQKKAKFPILDQVRSIETEADFPVTLSIGIGIAGKSPAETEQYADEARELALSRGGDQVIVKAGQKIEYFGGKTRTVEKRNKGKSRIIAHVLRQLMAQSSKVLIMGHKNPDMDCFGAALGIHRIASDLNKEAYIIMDHYGETLAALYHAAKETEEYRFINPEKAISLQDQETLVVVVDTHRPSLTECKELLRDSEKIVVIDHHRKAEESIANPVLAYTEPYASSTAELITEIIQYASEKKTLSKIEAEALLAGMTVDTNRFTVKTGVRTFEAAAWLRRAGADTVAVKKYFQTDVESFKARTKGIAAAQFLDGGIALSVCTDRVSNAQVVGAQIADELLMVQSIRASFVVSRGEDGKTLINARSLGDLNVQMMMEQLGGGGHLSIAGAQTGLSPEDTVKKIKEILKEIL